MTKSFGRRGAGASLSGPGIPPRKAFPQASFSSNRQDAPAQQSVGLASGDIAVEKEGGKFLSFVIACASGLTFSIIILGLYSGTQSTGFFTSRIFMNIASGIALYSFIPFLLLAARVLADVMRLVQVPRGYSDIMIGAILGSAMFLPSVTSNEPVDWRALAYVVGGGLGGFTYWRSRGYPGLRRKYTGAANLGFNALKRIKLD
ncbi:MAG: hypothetical protein JJ866_01180 [Roseibium sp.]|uniref:hypothetical protein n=1 Tax=Roseibium sp. TaxID=1936156 RepID=UPI001B15E223|nr:hypothetical protein [Roseibium sp.]MBO6890525.1 hypothetical protein [Roseibium sp.]MBO6929570.1 hypothetical protein [Roseibium sp.]